jgi:hypothetical protein
MSETRRWGTRGGAAARAAEAADPVARRAAPVPVPRFALAAAPLLEALVAPARELFVAPVPAVAARLAPARELFVAAFAPLAAVAARLRVLLLASATGTPSRGYARFLRPRRVVAQLQGGDRGGQVFGLT